MKKFMLLFVAVFVLSGCASDVLIQLPDGRLVPGPKQSKMDPNLRDAAEFTGTFGSMAGCWAKYGPLAGVGCAILGNKVTRAVVGEDYAAKNRMVVGQGSFGQDYFLQSGHIDGGPQKCYDQGSGGHADCDEYNNRYNGISYNRRLKQEQPVRRAVLNTPQEVIRSRKNMFERPEMRAQQVAENVAAKVVVDNQGVTVDNYWNSPMIHPACKVLNEETGLPLNHGADGKCLLKKSEVLGVEQKKCDCIADEGTACDKTIACPKKYNPGVWAGIYHRIGTELVELQKKEQDGVIATVSR